MSETLTVVPALTRLAEDEAIFRDSVYEFADREIRPLAREMDEHAKFNPGLIKKLFEMGVMSVEVPDSYAARAGRSSTPCWPSNHCRASIRRSVSWPMCRTRW